MIKSEIELKENWLFTSSEEYNWLPAKVPGTVHTDLIDNNKIEDPFFGINEQNLQWIGEKDWLYCKFFSLNQQILSKENVVLVFEGLDTFTEIYLNDILLLKSDNMFREWEIDCRELLNEGPNKLEIKFRNVFDENVPKWNKAPFRLLAHSVNDQADVMVSMYTRKAQFHYGWDWGP